MWPPTLTLDLLLLVSLFLGAHGEQMSYRPQNCTLECIRRGDPRCEYCRISADDVQISPSIPFSSPFGNTSIYNIASSVVKSHVLYHSDPFTHLSLDSEYAVTVMALPIPERWDQFYQRKQFFTRTCPEKNGLEECKKDWYPRYVEVHQENWDVYVTFNLAPENFKVRQYFSSCFGGGLRNYTSIKPDFSLNKTHHTYRLQNLQVGTNYTCEIAADVVDAVRKTFIVVVKHSSEVTQYYDKKLDEGQCVLLDRATCPPRLLICYSSNDGPAHVRVVLQLAAFLQKHMGTQVHLDLWEALSIMEEGSMGWHCRRLNECDFVLVICSQGLLQNQKQQSEDEEPLENTALAMISMIGEELCRAKALGRDLSKYMVATFEYSQESDIPAALGLASRYTLTKDLPLLFSHLHGVALQKPGVYLQVENISESGYCKLPAGAALQLAIQEATAQFSEEEHVGIPVIS
ncbi:interleukin-17 receptor D-like [Sinocyclocheilus rhinocerous]|uniref:interleukin-17 receptor D-like n=1 Tax=Sinocyclocheilus rhinocerous TaxID=307959 RepID=UPI0007BAC347|nr:PREDICTED: interleukin-17 receptor D-like [Sinocyclocheilus rhinocerous]